MSSLATLENVVKNILEKEPAAREDDMYLYYLFCTKYGFLNDYTFARLFRDKDFRKNVGLNSPESVGRCRRKLQADYEFLRPSARVQDARYNKTSEYIDYAIGGYNPTFDRLLEGKD